MRSRLALTVATFAMVGATLVGCGEDEPAPAPAPETAAVCDSVADLNTSVDDLEKVELTESGGVTDFQAGLTDVASDLTDVKADASSEFSTQVEAVTTTYDALKAALGAALNDPSAATIAGVGAALTVFSADVKALVSDVQSTC